MKYIYFLDGTIIKTCEREQIFTKTKIIHVKINSEGKYFFY